MRFRRAVVGLLLPFLLLAWFVGFTLMMIGDIGEKKESKK